MDHQPRRRPALGQESLKSHYDIMRINPLLAFSIGLDLSARVSLVFGGGGAGARAVV